MCPLNWNRETNQMQLRRTLFAFIGSQVFRMKHLWWRKTNQIRHIYNLFDSANEEKMRRFLKIHTYIIDRKSYNEEIDNINSELWGEHREPQFVFRTGLKQNFSIHHFNMELNNLLFLSMSYRRCRLFKNVIIETELIEAMAHFCLDVCLFLVLPLFDKNQTVYIAWWLISCTPDMCIAPTLQFWNYSSKLQLCKNHYRRNQYPLSIRFQSKYV